MPYNLASPHGIVEPVKLDDLEGWFAKELQQVSSPAERQLLKLVVRELDQFLRWPCDALLLWPESNRVPSPGAKGKYFIYPAYIREFAKQRAVTLDSRPNGPAIASFLLAGGQRPMRFGSSNRWSIHHLYSGKFAYTGRTATTHAAKECMHFTQSAGLVAAHPVADAMVDEFPVFAWLLRAAAFKQFGYDPDGVFSVERDPYGFAAGRRCKIVAAPL